jgi:hypothetical protein
MMNLLNENNKWELNIPMNNLTVNKRKDAMILLFFLNTYGDHDLAFKQLKKYWIDKLYKLPKPTAKEYSSIKTGRYITNKKMKNIYQMYLVEAVIADQIK